MQTKQTILDSRIDTDKTPHLIIPASWLEALDFKAGCQVIFQLQEGRIVVELAQADKVQEDQEAA